MQYLPEGFWNKEIGAARQHPYLRGQESADLLILGGGLSGMWAAHEVKKRAPEKEVVLLERDYLGAGPSGKAGGITYDLSGAMPRLRREVPGSAGELLRISREALQSISKLDCEWTPAGALHVSTNSFHDRASSEIVHHLMLSGDCQALSPAEVAERVSSPRLRGGVFYPRAATVHPAKLVRALGRELASQGVRIFEGTSYLSHERRGEGYLVRAEGGSVRARQVLLALGANRRVVRGHSYIVLSEPIDDLESFWPGGEALTDERASVRYMRKTADRRILFGWGFGGSRYDRRAIDEVAKAFHTFFPGKIVLEYSWGGEIDISPTHLPLIRQESPGLWSVSGYTGSGMGGTATAGRILAEKLLGSAPTPSFPEPRLEVPPEPLKSLLAALLRQAVLRKEAAEEREEKAKLWARFLAALPEKFGVHLGR